MGQNPSEAGNWPLSDENCQSFAQTKDLVEIFQDPSAWDVRSHRRLRNEIPELFTFQNLIGRAIATMLANAAHSACTSPTSLSGRNSAALKVTGYPVGREGPTVSWQGLEIEQVHTHTQRILRRHLQENGTSGEQVKSDREESFPRDMW